MSAQAVKAYVQAKVSFVWAILKFAEMRDKLKSGDDAGSDTFQIEMHIFARQSSRIKMFPILLDLKSTTKVMGMNVKKSNQSGFVSKATTFHLGPVHMEVGDRR